MAMRSTLSLLSLAAALAVPAPAAAQAPPAIDIANGVHGYVGTLLAAAPSGQPTRFEKSVCPAAYGLDAERTALLTNRMRSVAAAAGLPVAASPCRANVLLFITKDRQKLFADLSRDRNEVFGKLPAAQVSELRRDPQPVIAWQLTEPRGADGRALLGGQSDSEPMLQTAVTTSRLLAGARFDLDVSVVVLDARSLVGLTVTEIADYALMRALVPEKLSASVQLPVPSILNMMAAKNAGKPVPLSITDWDLAYLKGLYAKRGVSFTAPDRSRVEEGMRAALGSGAAS